jgi:hypothetical protein
MGVMRGVKKNVLLSSAGTTIAVYEVHCAEVRVSYGRKAEEAELS